MNEENFQIAVNEPAALQPAPAPPTTFSFFKGGLDVLAPESSNPFDWDASARKVREQLGEAMNARNLSFLFGSGCSSLWRDGGEQGIPTMAPMAKEFLAGIGAEPDHAHLTIAERDMLKKRFGINVSSAEYAKNLERLMEVLYSLQFVLRHSEDGDHHVQHEEVSRIIGKVTRHVVEKCTVGEFSNGSDAVLSIYESFYQKLIFRDRALPRPWVFTTNYDLFSETAMDRRGIPYCNGFSGTIERRFNPAVFRYSLAEQLDITSRKWSAVDSFVYLCKLHGSVNWIEDNQTLFPIRELQAAPPGNSKSRAMIYPTPAKQNASFGSPYSDLFREFQARIVRDQSVLITVGYSFGDEHLNNIIFQALTIPNFRLVVIAQPGCSDVITRLQALDDPRIWIIGGARPGTPTMAHYFDTFVEKFMPEAPGDKVDAAVAKVLKTLISPKVEGVIDAD